jgi:hypothetical protein
LPPSLSQRISSSASKDWKNYLSIRCFARTKTPQNPRKTRKEDYDEDYCHDDDDDADVDGRAFDVGDYYYRLLPLLVVVVVVVV